MARKHPDVRGVNVDSQNRCSHYNKPVDIIAIKMKCCGVYYACKDCHAALAGHAIQVWPRSEWDQKAILCGACGGELTIDRYLNCGHRCPTCQSDFNAACHSHHQYYFDEMPD
jgi:uncharacterized CHY-type Zn-finger protein